MSFRIFRKLFALFRHLLHWTNADSLLNESAFNLARENGLDRRRHARVKLPRSTRLGLPLVKAQGSDLSPVDVSVGGACIYDPKELLLPALGGTAEVDFVWPNKSERVQVKVVGVSKGDNRHLQFLNLSASTEKQLEELIRVATDALTTRQAPLIKNSAVQLRPSELWTNPKGDSLCIYLDGEPRAEWFGRLGHVVIGMDGICQAPLATQQGLAMFLANIPYPSLQLQRLTEVFLNGMAPPSRKVITA